MATTVPVYEENNFSIGRVFQRAFAAVALNPLVIVGLAVLVGVIPTLAMTYLFVQTGITSPQMIQSGALSPTRMMGAMTASALVTMIIAALVQGALTRAVVSANEGRKSTFGESLGTGLRVILPLIILSIVFAVGVGIGFVFLVIPGIILLLMWAVAVPVLVVERKGVFESLGRSAELTKGARWKILGLFLVLAVCYWLLSIVLGLMGMNMYGPTSAGGLSTGGLVAAGILGTIFNVIWGAIQPSLYVELRQAKEGGSLDNLEEVFG